MGGHEPSEGLVTHEVPLGLIERLAAVHCLEPGHVLLLVSHLIMAGEHAAAWNISCSAQQWSLHVIQ